MALSSIPATEKSLPTLHVKQMEASICFSQALLANTQQIPASIQRCKNLAQHVSAQKHIIATLGHKIKLQEEKIALLTQKVKVKSEIVNIHKELFTQSWNKKKY